jgi:Ca2+-binding EF-hand superfamily protein
MYKNSKGLKWSEDLVDELLKTADPKSDGKFQFEDFIKKLIK